TYENMAELIRLGAYRRGTDPDVDRAMQFYPQLETFISQREKESATLDEGYELLAKVLGVEPPPAKNGGQDGPDQSVFEIARCSHYPSCIVTSADRIYRYWLSVWIFPLMKSIKTLLRVKQREMDALKRQQGILENQREEIYLIIDGLG